MSHEQLNEALKSVAHGNARARLEKLFDNGTIVEFDKFLTDNGEPCGVVTAGGYVSGMRVYAFSQDASVRSGGMTVMQAKKIKRVYEMAAKTGAPVVGIYDSKGAVITEGVKVLSAYSELIGLSNRISGVVPQLSLVLGVCSGVSAVLANTADVLVMSENAQMYVTPANVAADKNVGTAKLSAENGTAADVRASEDEAIDAAKELLAYIPANNLSLPAVADYVPAVGGDVLESVVDEGSFFELYKDYADCVSVGFARIGGMSVGVVATNGKKLCGNDALKIVRFVRLCDAYSIPLVTLLDCEGILGSDASEIYGDVKSISLLTQSYSEATNVKVTLIAGKAYASVFAAFAGNSGNADMVFALEDAQIGVLPPATAVQFAELDKLGDKSREELESEYTASCSALSAAAEGFVDDVITKDEAAAKIISALETLSSKRVSTLDKKHTVLPL